MSDKRFRTESEILAAIDRCKADAHAKLVKAEALEAEAKELGKRLYDAGAVWSKTDDAFAQVDYLIDQATSLKRAAKRLLDTRAKRLGEKLSEFRTRAVVPLTEQLGIGDDSVKA